LKKIFAVLIMLCAVHAPAFSAPADTAAAPTVQEKAVLSAAPVWPDKAAWVGQQATLVPAKLNVSASYLLIFQQPGQDMSGIDQLHLARKHLGKPFIIEGLYKLEKKKAVTRYFWRLAAKDGGVLWVRDYPDVALSALPFALEREIAAEKRAMAEIGALVGNTVWIDRNYIPKAELTAAVDHLAPLTVTAFKSTGPFSEAYTLDLKQADGTPVAWTVAPAGQRAAFSNEQFYGMIRSGFMRHDPQTLFPHWSPEDWRLISGQEIRVGWEREKVLMSWGEPRLAPALVAKGPEEDMYEARYGKYYLYFKNDKLMKIKTPDPAVTGKKADTKAAPAGKTSSREGNKDGPKIKMIELQEATKEGN
jgi:hypothetical protein